MQITEKQKKPILLRILSAILLILLGIFVLAALLLFVTERWMFHTWASLAIDEIIYHLNASLDGTNPAMVTNYIFHYGIYALVGLVVFIVSMVLSRRNGLTRAVLACLWIAVSIGLIEFSGFDTDRRIGLRDYVIDMLAPPQESTGDFIHDNFVDAGTAEIKFPEKKRNLIYIYMESMEMTYADKANGGAFEQNTIPELVKLVQENEDFSGDSKELNGAISLPGSTWTIGALFAQTSGMPLKLPSAIHQEVSHLQEDFFSSLTVLGDLLDQQGYRQVFMLGSDAEFGGRRAYYQTHGNYEICDYDWAKKQGIIPEDYFVFWGFEDARLFAAAKNKLTELAKSDEPFNFSILTVDTHFEDGYVCDLCKNKFGDNQYANVMACSSHQIYDFIQWIQKQDFYKNTTIVISGDHPTMDVDFCEDVPESYQRRVVTAFINSAVEPVNPSRSRFYSTMDLYPTTLASLGATIKGNRLGLGTNLFSLTDTLLEQYGKDACSEGIRSKTPYMDSLFYGTATEDALIKAAEEAQISYAVDEDGTVNFILDHIKELNAGAVRSAKLELTNAQGEKTTYDMVFYQPEQNQGSYWCYVNTDYKESDLPGMYAEAFFSIEGTEHYSMASKSF